METYIRRQQHKKNFIHQNIKQKEPPQNPLLYRKTGGLIEAFNSTSRYLDDLLNIDNPYFDTM